jgi:hypothetical protein
MYVLGISFRLKQKKNSLKLRLYMKTELYNIRTIQQLSVVVHTYNPSIQESEAGSRVPGQPGLHSKSLLQKKKKKTQTTQL